MALVVTSLLTRKIKDVRFILVYPVICLVTLVAVLIGHSQTLMIAALSSSAGQARAVCYRL